jgi:superfamily II DNA/RNA helicase
VRGIDVSRYINKPAEEVAAPVFVPTHAFIDFSIDERLKANIVRKGYVTPTPIQDTAIPHVLDGKDVVGIANTGTGKTAAFLIPLIHKVLTRPQERILIMVPTRELAQQIAEELNGFSAGLRMLSVVCVGGIGIGPQIAGLRRNPQFVIGTPGRLKDLIERRVLSLGSFRTAVLDEGDRMLDMGFVNDMRRILALLPQPRQTLFFSATLSPEIERFIGEFIHDPVHVSVRVRSTAASVEQK